MAEKHLSGQQSRRRRGPTPKSKGLWVYLAEDERELVEQARLILTGTPSASAFIAQAALERAHEIIRKHNRELREQQKYDQRR
ncbi:MAG TPA: hypothetical protein VNV88_12625 [Candidatus Solibacter sp.]|jgi:uncharacterized protein (DUF1778 family)|nr:hypothetical protein [Candidatus Solibacter sp.]